jgi:energy-coupling factor transport system substrate-specific component
MPGAGVADALRRYASFYLTTSLVWDAAAALGNAVLLAVLGIPVVRALARFRDKLQFQVRPL